MISWRKQVAKMLDGLGYNIARKAPPPDMEPEFLELFSQCSPHSMTSVERMYGLYSSVNYIVNGGVQGAFVECGVWQGGSSMMMAGALRRLGQERDLWLYDTYAGMTEPTDKDKDFGGRTAEDKWRSLQNGSGSTWCRAGLATVRRNMEKTGYADARIRYVEGPVEKTLAEQTPDCIALLRLDTDWYESTLAELEHLYPRLSRGGVLIVDDYGHWKGAREAVDEYFSRADVDAPLLTRLDYTGRLAVRCN